MKEEIPISGIDQQNPKELVGDALFSSMCRGQEVMEIAARSTVLVHTENGPKVLLEHFPTSANKLSHVEQDALWTSVKAINEALDAGLVEVTPGISTLKLTDIRGAIELLAPGLIDWEVIARKKTTGGRDPLATVGYQWIPPGVTLELTPQETGALAVAIASAALPTIRKILRTAGANAAVAAGLAIVLVALALNFAAARLLSPTSAVKLKYTIIPIPTVVILPVL